MPKSEAENKEKGKKAQESSEDLSSLVTGAEDVDVADIEIPETEEDIDVEGDIEGTVPEEPENANDNKEVDELDAIVDGAAATQAKRSKSVPKHRQTKGMPKDIASGDMINRADRKTKRQLYAKADVFAINPAKPPVTEADERKQTYLELVQSANAKMPLTGRLESIKQNKGHVLGVVSYKDASVYIPAEYLFEFDPSTVRERVDEDRQTAEFNAKKLYTSWRLGAEIQFIAMQVFEADPTNAESGALAIGTRVGAMEQIAKRFFVDPAANGKPELFAGLHAEGVITYITKTGIGVEVFGTETFIPARELSWKRVGDVVHDDDDYHIGKHIVVVIKDVRPTVYKALDRQFNMIDLTLSVREAMANPNKKYFNSFVEKQIVTADVKQITEDGIFVTLAKKRDALCEFPNNLQIPPEGSVVRVKILRKYEGANETDIDKKYRIYAAIQAIIRMGRGEERVGG